LQLSAFGGSTEAICNWGAGERALPRILARLLGFTFIDELEARIYWGKCGKLSCFAAWLTLRERALQKFFKSRFFLVDSG